MPKRLLQEILPNFWWLIRKMFFITIHWTSGLKWHWDSFKFQFFFQCNQTGNSNFNQKSGPNLEATKSTNLHVHMLLRMLNLLKLFSFDPVNVSFISITLSALIFPISKELFENHSKQEHARAVVDICTVQWLNFFSEKGFSTFYPINIILFKNWGKRRDNLTLISWIFLYFDKCQRGYCKKFNLIFEGLSKTLWFL
jgi:hypothetical protein